MTDTLVGTSKPQIATLSLKIFRGPTGLEQLAEAWHDLAIRCGNHYLHFPMWYQGKLRHLDKNPDNTWFFSYRDNQRLIAVIPLSHENLMRQVLGVKLRMPVWSLYYPDEMGMCDATIDPHYRSATLRNLLLRDLKALNDKPWFCLLCRHLGAASHLYPAFADQSRWQGIAKVSHDSKFLPAHQPYERAIGDYSKKFRRNLRRKQNKLASMGRVHYRFVRAADQVPTALEDFLVVEASGWKGEKGSSLRSQPGQLAMYRDLLRELGRHGNAGIHLLELNGRVIAGQIAVYAGSSIYLLKIGFDEEFGAVSPGFLLVNELWRHACDELSNIKRVSFVTGVGWTNVWKPETETVYCAYCFRWPPVNLVAGWFLRLRQWLGKPGS